MTVYVVSAPSGAGKTTLNRRLLQNHPHIEMSVSHTTRRPRPGEVHGSDYHFISSEEFRAMIENHEFIEWAEVHGNLYGTSLGELNRILEAQHIPILEIDVQGWALARPKLDNARSIFILPPSLKSLWERLEGRGSDSLESRWVRLQNAYHEIKNSDGYDHFIINNNLDEAYEVLKSMVVDGKSNEMNDEIGKNLRRKLNEEFKNADWVLELRKKMS